MSESSHPPGKKARRDGSPPVSPAKATDGVDASRRDFLTGQFVARAIEQQVDAAAQPETGFVQTGDPSHDRQAAYLEHFSKRAMACSFEFLFNMRQYPQSAQASGEAFALIDELEAQMTVYRDESEISQLNRDAFGQAVRLEPQLFSLLQQAIEIYHQTDRAFDMTAGPLSTLWGFDQRKGALPTQEAIDDVRSRVGSHHLQLDSNANSVCFLTDGVQINLGGIGKGYAIDRVASLLHMQGVHDFAIHGGQSSVRCGGDFVGDGAVGGWPIGLSHPVLPGVRLAHFHLRDGALGTSGSGRQGFYHEGKRYGHIIDPRTGWPQSDFLSTTVISPSAALSDALATAFYVMTEAQIETFCRAHREVSAVLLKGDPANGRADVDVVWFNLRDDQWSIHRP